MKTAIRSAIGLALVSLSLAREFRPEGRLENLPATDTSVQQCYIFHTVPGVLYRVESTHDLSQWTTEDEIYGVGHEFVVAMREFTPPPPPGPGDPPVAPPVDSISISLRIQPSSGAAGGTVVSWVSLDSGGPVIMHLSQSMTTGWDQMPFFWENYGVHQFFIYHDMTAISPPGENPTLQVKDAAMFAQLETSFPVMTQAVDESVARARNTPPPAPADPNAAKFWRVHCDWGLDTDQDGSTDWAEFEMAALTSGGPTPPLRADAYNGDTNDNGIPDGEELDFDKDSIADAKDIAAADASATYPIGLVPRYAMFPITNALPSPTPPDDQPVPLQISEKGTVLYQNGTWTAGAWTALTSTSNGLSGATARAIKDENVVLGFATATGAGLPFSQICYWPDPGASTSPIGVATVGTRPYLATTASDGANGPGEDFVANLLAPGPILSNDGHFHMGTSRWDSEENRYTFEGYGHWQLPTASQPNCTLTASSRGMRYDSGNLSWGMRPKPTDPFEFEGGLIIWGNYSRPCDFQPTNLTVLPNRQILAMSKYEKTPAQAWYDNAWHLETIYSQSIDISADGTSIGKNHDGMTAPILINGKWTGIDAYAPGVSEEWKTGTTLLDTTPGGWVLAEHKPASGAMQYGVLLPIRLNGVDPDYTTPTVSAGQPIPEPPDYFSGGVDHLTARAEGGGGYVPELWIMSPISGSNSVRWKAPLNATSKIKPECDKAAFSPAEITASGTTVQVSGNDLAENEDAAVTDFPATLKLGAAQQASSSIPVKVMRMKKRTVNVALHYVYSVDSTQLSALPFYQPDNADLQLYLNKIFGPQVNVSFVVSEPFIEGSVSAGYDFDKDNDGRLETNINDEFKDATPNAKVGLPGSNFNIDVWMIGGKVQLTSLTNFDEEVATGLTFEGKSKIIINGNEAVLAPFPMDKRTGLLHFIIAHEIGHAMSNLMKHPGESKYNLNLKWPTQHDPYLKKRLMCPGPKMDTTNPGTCLIKKEWDAIEVWLHEHVDPNLQ